MKRIKDYFPPQFLRKKKKLLASEEKRLAKEKKRLEKEDPILNPERSSAKTAEFVDEATEGLGHERIEAQKGILERLLIETRLALSKMKLGKYGICEKCGERIDRARLEAFPQARYCIDCQKKVPVEEKSA